MVKVLVLYFVGGIAAFVQLAAVCLKLVKDPFQVIDEHQLAAADRRIYTADADLDRRRITSGGGRIHHVRFQDRQASGSELLAPVLLALGAAHGIGDLGLAGQDRLNMLAGGLGAAAAVLVRAIFPVGVEDFADRVFGQKDARGVDAAEVQAQEPMPIRRDGKPRGLVPLGIEAIVNEPGGPGEKGPVEYIELPQRQVAPGPLELLLTYSGKLVLL